MAILEWSIDTAGQVGNDPRTVRIVSNDTLDTITSAGYLNGLVAMGFQIRSTDQIAISSQTANIGIFTASISSTGIITLSQQSPFNGTFPGPMVLGSPESVIDILGILQSTNNSQIGIAANPFSALIFGQNSLDYTTLTYGTVDHEGVSNIAIPYPGLETLVYTALSSQSAVTQASSISTGVSITGPSGIITTVSLTTAASTTAGSFVVTNPFYKSTAQVISLTASYGGATTGSPHVFISAINAGSNTFTITVMNVDTAAAFNGTLKIYFNIM